MISSSAFQVHSASMNNVGSNMAFQMVRVICHYISGKWHSSADISPATLMLETSEQVNLVPSLAMMDLEGNARIVQIRTSVC